jgi:hypothetical protein
MMPQKFDYEYVKTYFEENSCILLSTEYKNQLQKLDYMCVCGNKSTISFNAFKRGQRCSKCGAIKSHKNSRRTIEEVRSIFKSEGCKLISTNYKNNKQMLDYICSCGTPHQIRLNDFLNGVRCKNCFKNTISKAKKLSYEFVKKEFEKRNCILLSTEYNGSNEKLKFICECGNEGETTYNNFIHADVRCSECYKRKFREKIGLSYEYVKEQFEKSGCKLLSTEYINSNTLLDYKCSCGNISKISYDNFRAGHRCYECSGKTKWNYEIVKNYFNENGCVLLSKEYKTANHKLDYICSCGNHSSIKFSMFLEGHRCKKCGIEKITGENNWNWNGGISTILQYFRQRTIDWKKDSMFNSNYKCIITGEKFDVIHHIYGFDQIIDEVFSNFNIVRREIINEYSDEEIELLTQEIIRLHAIYPLGVCLTDQMHDEFHKIYGYGKNTPEQFYEFYRMKTGKEYNQQPLNNAI